MTNRLLCPPAFVKFHVILHLNFLYITSFFLITTDITYVQVATSKVDHMSDTDEGTESFHSHGEALCSISCISLLEVVTKARGKPYGYKKIIKVAGTCFCINVNLFVFICAEF